MIEFGATLRAAREAKGLSLTDMAQKTHLMSQQIESLENEDFSKIAAPIYGRGFVKLYCEAVGLDPQPMIAEFMEIFNGNRMPTIRMRPPKPAPEPAPKPTPEPAPPEPAAPEPTPEPEFRLEAELAPAPAPEPAPDPPPAEPPARRPSRYAAPVPLEDERVFTLPHIPRAVWRILALALAALVILWILFSGLSALCRALRGSPTEEAAETAVVETSVSPATDTVSEKPIPPLYID